MHMMAFLASLDRDLAGSGLTIRPSPGGDGNCGVYTTRQFAPGDTIGPSGPKGTGIHHSAIVDPVIILRHHPVAKRAVEVGGASESFAFWLALAAIAKDAETIPDTTESVACNTRTDTKTKRDNDREKFVPHGVYLASLPREAPAPVSWSDGERSKLLAGTPLAKQAEIARKELREEYDRVVAALSKKRQDQSSEICIPFDIDGRGICPSLLWARGIHMSRSFPRSLVDVARNAAASTSSNDDVNPTSILRFEQGGLRAPTIHYSGPSELAPGYIKIDNIDTSILSPSAFGATTAGTASTLGIMIPFYDILNHKCGQNIGWEAGSDGHVRFRCLEVIEECDQVYNNYGCKSNAELLYTYGFAVRDNPLDSVDGILVGCKCPIQGGDAESHALHEARLKLLQERGISHKIGDGALTMGPFSLRATRSRSSNDGDEKEAECGILPAELLFALSLIRMKTVEKGPGLSIDDVELLRLHLNARIKKLEVTENVNKAADVYSREGFCAAYREGQLRLLRMALAEVDALAQTCSMKLRCCSTLLAKIKKLKGGR